MLTHNTIILKFNKQGEKTGWTYIDIPVDIAHRLKSGNKKSFRVKGKLDECPIKGVALLPMGEGAFIMPLNAEMRKKIGKKQGALLKVQLEEDKAPFQFNADFLACLEEDSIAKKFFDELTGSHQRYFSKWIDAARTEETKAKRIAKSLNALTKKMGYAEMIRSLKNDRIK